MASGAHLRCVKKLSFFSISSLPLYKLKHSIFFHLKLAKNRIGKYRIHLVQLSLLSIAHTHIWLVLWLYAHIIIVRNEILCRDVIFYFVWTFLVCFFSRMEWDFSVRQTPVDSQSSSKMNYLFNFTSSLQFALLTLIFNLLLLCFTKLKQ